MVLYLVAPPNLTELIVQIKKYTISIIIFFEYMYKYLKKIVY